MRITLFITAFAAFFCCAAYSQSCLPEGITFETQAQINNFQANYPGCTEIEGDVIIQGSDIANLNALSVLSSVGGDLIIGPDNDGNHLLTSLVGLESLASIGGNLIIGNTFSDNHILSSLEGLEGLTSVGGHLEILNNNELSSLAALGNLTYIGTNLLIEGNTTLISLTGLEGLTSIGGSLSIYSNDELTSLTGLNNLTDIGNSLSLDFNEVLPDLSGLESLETIGYDLVLYANYDIINLAGINNLTHIGGNLQIESNDALTGLSGLENLNFIGGILEIYSNDELVSLTGLDNIDAASVDQLTICWNSSLYDCDIQSICEYLASPSGSISIYKNADGCNNPPEVAAACGIELSCLPFGNYYFFCQADIDNFQINYPECSELEGYVAIQGSDINNLSGLNSVSIIGGNFFINNNENLTCLSGLDNLTYVEGHLNIGYWEGINQSLTSLNGLESLDSVGGNLDIINNPVLVSLAGLTNLTAIGGSLSVIYNDSLTSLAGLDNIDPSTITYIHIGGNSSLATCETKSVCDYLANPNGNIDINDNAPGCNSQEEVTEACEVGIDESAVGSRQSAVNIYPNPASTAITIETTASTPKFLVSIFNLNGQEIIRQQITEYKTEIDISHLPAGIYFLKLTSDDIVEVLKIVKE